MARRLLPHYIVTWRKCSLRRGIYIEEGGSALSVSYTNTGGQRQREGRREDSGGDGVRQILGDCSSIN